MGVSLQDLKVTNVCFLLFLLSLCLVEIVQFACIFGLILMKCWLEGGMEIKLEPKKKRIKINGIWTSVQNSRFITYFE